ncbi:pre-peptidase C-terminal domain-containing protein [Calothrix sp. FACHB-1219]|uniref:PPC domain-containing protein n=1 Tax=unclassified Calothrix TaxID=2619626 RepID=UPI001688B5A8|nr:MULTISPECIES: PPC domain-containing protein [unclassified Calothrix]MBD2203039.1 pre-peptidase C-terminal domain-containing protein [Calothrix sp. FACHB-168]MBD2218639.1 pre-peptidase C-terminal domain-containing protein [Calothrix sp. FACHB-1219]
MPLAKHQKFPFLAQLAIFLTIGNSFLVSSFSLPINAVEVPLVLRKFIIAKPPDERQPEAVEQGIEQIPTSQPPVAPQPRQSIDSPLPPRVPPTTTNTAPSQPVNPAPQPRQTVPPQPVNPAPQPRQTAPSQPVNPAPQPRQTTPSQPVNPAPQPRQTTPSQPVNNRSPRPESGRYQPTTKPRTNNQPTREVSPVSLPANLNYKPINFVDFAFGILSKGDFQSQGRYYHFYQFEGRANQLVQIRLGGSTDTRRSNNLSLNPYMFLLDPDNNVIVKRSSTQTTNGIKDAFVFVRLPVDGTYTIAVTSRNPGDTGRYSLALRNDRASYVLDESAQLTAQSLTLKQNKSPYDITKFEGKKNQLVSIRADSLYEEFSPYLVLLNSQGQIIAADNANDGRFSALIDRARLPGDDTYYVVVTSANPQERGRYRLTLY